MELTQAQAARFYEIAADTTNITKPMIFDIERKYSYLEEKKGAGQTKGKTFSKPGIKEGRL